MTVEDNRGYKFYHEILKSPKFVTAPMVEGSELSFRLLTRKYGAQLAYTPMIQARHFVQSAKLRDEYLYNCSYDRPLIAQFCVNNTETFLKAVELAKDHCDAIDINLGCPQNIAKRGHYGAFLQDDWDLIGEMIQKATEKYNIPITCKIRVFKDVQKTIEYAKMIEKSGCCLLTVHGRTREMKGQFTGLADWNQIKRVKEELKIPVFANGNVQSMKDIQDCFDFTKVDAVMCAEALLYNPALFSSLHVPSWLIIDEYLQFVKNNCKAVAHMRSHLFKMANLSLQLPENFDLRTKLGKSFKVEQFQEISNELRKRYELNEDQIVPMTNLPLPHYLTQPYFHHPLIPKTNDESKLVNDKLVNKDSLNKSDDDFNSDSNENKEQNGEFKNLNEFNEQSNNSRKRKNKFKTENIKIRRQMILCKLCSNPKGLSCEHNLCKKCCKTLFFNSLTNHSCAAHKLNTKKIKSNEQCKQTNEIDQNKFEENENFKKSEQNQLIQN